MTRYAFTGDPTRGGDGPAVIVWHGVTFPKGVPVEVSAELAAKLDRHNHWTRFYDDVAADRMETPDEWVSETFAPEIAPTETANRKRGRPRKT